MHPWLINFRTWGRKIGLPRLISTIRGNRDYEERFRNAVMAQVKSGDVVWDIGANVGFYTALFKDSIGPDGLVVAFEPAPGCYEALTERFTGCKQVRLENVALGAADAGAKMLIDSRDSTVNQIMSTTGGAPDGKTSVDISIVRCDSYWKAVGSTPNVVKIDVEGFEEEVISGMGELLQSRQLRAIFVEVHFKLLAERGRAQAPAAIRHVFRRQGYATRWVDWSHLEAVRK